MTDEFFGGWNFLKWSVVGVAPREHGDYFFMNERSGCQPWLSAEGAD